MNTSFRFLIFLLLLGSKTYSQEKKSLFSPTYFETQQFAHRGGYSSGPENTIPTILYNLSKGITSIEIDLSLTRDNHLILFHDETTYRLLNTEKKYMIHQWSWKRGS